MMNFDIKKIEPFPIIASIFFIIGFIIPGLFFIFLFNQKLFISLDYFRLILLSISICFPFMTLNYFFYSRFAFSHKGNVMDEVNYQVQHSIASFSSSFFSTFPLYSSILIKYFFNITLKTGILISFGIEIFIILLLLILTKR